MDSQVGRPIQVKVGVKILIQRHALLENRWEPLT